MTLNYSPTCIYRPPSGLEKLPAASLGEVKQYGTVLHHIADIWKALTILNGSLSADSGIVYVIFFMVMLDRILNTIKYRIK